MSHKAKALITAVLVSLFTIPALAKIIHVPADQPTIQAGINGAVTGDTVLVAAGTYYENINFNGKAITVTSASGPAGTVIDGSNTQGYAAAVTFSTNESSSSVISGFTIQNGRNGVVYIQQASPTITGNVITNTTSPYGTAIDVFVGGGLVQANLITNAFGGVESNGDSDLKIVGNLIAGGSGSGIYLNGSGGSDVIQQNSVVNNGGNGFYYWGSGNVNVIQNFVAENQGPSVIAGYPSGVVVVSNTIANNRVAGCCGSNGSELDVYSLSSSFTLQNNLIVGTGNSAAMDCTVSGQGATFTNNDVFSALGGAYTSQCPDPTGTDGNISVDPLFVDLLGDNYHIQSGSPAGAAGTSSAPDEPSTDWDGDPRILNGMIDIGADESNSPTAAALSAYALHFGAQDMWEPAALTP
jgi:hypothetical protein